MKIGNRKPEIRHFEFSRQNFHSNFPPDFVFGNFGKPISRLNVQLRGAYRWDISGKIGQKMAKLCEKVVFALKC